MTSFIVTFNDQKFSAFSHLKNAPQELITHLEDITGKLAISWINEKYCIRTDEYNLADDKPLRFYLERALTLQQIINNLPKGGLYVRHLASIRDSLYSLEDAKEILESTPQEPAYYILVLPSGNFRVCLNVDEKSISSLKNDLLFYESLACGTDEPSVVLMSTENDELTYLIALLDNSSLDSAQPDEDFFTFLEEGGEHYGAFLFLDGEYSQLFKVTYNGTKDSAVQIFNEIKTVLASVVRFNLN